MFSRKPSLPKTLNHWYADISSVQKLRALLEDPTFKEACATLVNAALPTFSNTVSSAANNDARCWLAGYTDFVRDLEKLAKAPNDKDPYGTEWDHIEP